MKNSSLQNLKPLHIQSNGMGVQSKAMYLMSCLGVLPRFDYSIFVNLGNEKKATIDEFKCLQKWAVENDGIPIIELSGKNLLDSSLQAIKKENNSFVSIPFFSSGSGDREGMLRRQCSSEFKIRQVNECIKSLYGLSGNQRFPETYVYIGISIDEVHRIGKPSPVKFTNVYPFCNYQTGYHTGSVYFGDPGMLMTSFSRTNCVNWLLSNGFSVPPSSSCVFCPYTTDKAWVDLRDNEPESFAVAVEFDKAMRHGRPGEHDSSLFLHRSCVPLDEVDFKIGVDDGLFECSGTCHV